jgi:Tfp pilus tip-associated adhesin PilY1
MTEETDDGVVSEVVSEWVSPDDELSGVEVQYRSGEQESFMLVIDGPGARAVGVRVTGYASSVAPNEGEAMWSETAVFRKPEYFQTEVTWMQSANVERVTGEASTWVQGADSPDSSSGDPHSASYVVTHSTGAFTPDRTVISEFYPEDS